MPINNPSDIAGLVADWDAASLGLSDGASVTSWTDDVNSLTLTAAENNTTYKDGSNYPHGKPYLEFPGNCRMKVTDATLDLANATYIVLGEFYQAGDWLFNKQATNPATISIRIDGTISGTGRLEAIFRDTSANAKFATAVSMPPKGVHCYVASYDGTDGKLILDNATVASVAFAGGLDSAPTGPFSLGGHPGVTSATANGRIFRVLVYNSGLSSADLTDLYNWYLANYEPRYEKPASAILGGDVASPSAWLDGTTYHIFVHDKADDSFDYYTAPESDPTDWTLQQADAFNPAAATRGVCILKEGSTWYCFYDDRVNGHIHYASGASLTSLSNQAQLFTGAAGKYYRQPAVVPPSLSHDGDWQLLLDIRTDAATGGAGHLIAASGADLGSLVEDGEVISESGTGDWIATDVGSPSVKWIDGQYVAIVAGYDKDGDVTADYAPHSIGLYTSTDFATWTAYGDNPVLDFTLDTSRFDATAVAEPELLQDLTFLYAGHDSSTPLVSAVGLATLSASGSSTVQGAGASAGTSTAAATGRATARAAGSAAGTSTASATGRATARADGSAAGTSTATADSRATARAAGSAAGTSTATATARATARAAGTAAGTSTATATSDQTTQAAGSAAGTSTAAAAGRAVVRAAGSAAGTSTAAATGRAVVRAAGSAAGTSTATGSLRAKARAAGVSAGVAQATATMRATLRAAGSAAGTSTATGVIRDAALPLTALEPAASHTLLSATPGYAVLSTTPQRSLSSTTS